MESFTPAPGRNVVYCYPRDPNDFHMQMHAHERAQYDLMPEDRTPFSYDGYFEFRPAQIVRVWSPSGLKTCNLVVFLDGSNDVNLEPSASTLSVWKTSVSIADDPAVAQAFRYFPRVP